MKRPRGAQEEDEPVEEGLLTRLAGWVGAHVAGALCDAAAVLGWPELAVPARDSDDLLGRRQRAPATATATEPHIAVPAEGRGQDEGAEGGPQRDAQQLTWQQQRWQQQQQQQQQERPQQERKRRRNEQGQSMASPLPAPPLSPGSSPAAAIEVESQVVAAAGSALPPWATAHAPHGRGILNYGSSCFLNVVVQCLAHTPQVRLALGRGLAPHLAKAHEEARGEGRAAPGLLAAALAPCVYCLACDSVGAVLDPVAQEPVRPDCGLLACLGAGYDAASRQEDAHEFLYLLLQTLGEPVLSVFRGACEAVCECSVCRRSFSTREPLLDLSLPIARPEVDSIDRALDLFLGLRETLENDNAYDCSHCGVHVRAGRAVRVALLPRVLVIHLKRFADSQVKLAKHIAFDEFLHAWPTERVGRGQAFRLVAVVVHAGDAAHCGHFYCYVRVDRRGWLKLDDAAVEPAHWEQVRGDQAYMLWYEQVNPQDGQ
jgi:ubiquitin C-terminal hydrolase